METRVYLMVVYYTPYTHNGLTEDNAYYIVKSQAEAIRGMVDEFKFSTTASKEPQMTIKSTGNGVCYEIAEDCITDGAKSDGGYAYKVEIIEKTINI